MKGHENCTHGDIESIIIDSTEALVVSTLEAMGPMVARGEIDPGDAGISSASMIFATGLETGLRAALMDPIGGQMLIDYFDEIAPVQGLDLAEANQVLAEDARHLLEAVARRS